MSPRNDDRHNPVKLPRAREVDSLVSSPSGPNWRSLGELFVAAHERGDDVTALIARASDALRTWPASLRSATFAVNLVLGRGSWEIGPASAEPWLGVARTLEVILERDDVVPSGAPVWRALSPHIERLDVLGGVPPVGSRHAHALLRVVERLPNVRTLDLSGVGLPPTQTYARFWEALFDGLPNTVHRLNLATRAFGGAAVRFLVRSPVAKKLRRLSLRGCLLEASARALAHWPEPGSLTALDLSDTPIGPKTLLALLESPLFDRVTHLGLAGTTLGEALTRALVDSPLGEHAIAIDFNSSSPDFQILCSADRLPHLRDVRLAAVGCDEYTLPLVFADRRWIDRLHRIDWTLNGLGDEQAEWLRAKEPPASLRELWMEGNEFTERGRERINSWLRPSGAVARFEGMPPPVVDFDAPEC
jgi:hypothetical protein